ncbi:Protein piccolo [Acipenser ruthenus]|uniref:Protein piccolo n=1 Tax=Acipenser ruthenus TaxID=7906 RepID=A0A444U4G2_ACIRT|nr:Protein piccolo [Acipenser ruthenus]
MGMDVSGPPMAKPQPQQPKQQVTPGSPQKGKHGSPVPALQKSEPSKTPEPKKPSPLTKQQSMSSSPPIKLKQPLSDSLTQKPAQQKDSTPKPDPSRPQEDTKQKQTGVQKPPDQTVSTSPAPGIKQASQVPQGPPPAQQKQPTQVQDATKPTSQPPQAGVKQMQPDSKLQPQQKSSPKPTEQSLEAKSQKSEDPTKQAQTQLKETVKGVTLKTEPKTGLPVLEPAKSEQQLPKGSPVPTAAKPTQPAQVQPIQQPPKPQEQSRRFSLNIGGIIETPKPQPTTPQETVTGKLFGFGSSFFSQASNLINMADKPAEQPAPVAKQQPPSQPVTRQQPPKEASSAQSSPKLPPAKKETQPPVAQKPEQPVVGKAPASGQEKKSVSEKEVKPPVEATKTMAGSSAPPAPPKSNCPLCKVELNIGSKDPPNFTTCTECKNVVCNLCGFNPMPHLTESKKLGRKQQWTRKPEVGETHQPRQPGKPPDQGPSGITKSQTTNVFKTEKPKPGRSPSSISLLESRSRPEVKEDPKAAMMPSFLSEGNPLSAMSSVVNKFSLFGDAEETQEEALKKQKGAQQQKAQSQQPGPTKAAQQQGSPKLTQQQQGPSRPGPQQQAGPIHPQQQGPPKTGPQQQGPAKTGPQQQGPPLTGPQQQGPAKTGPQQQGPAKTGPQQQGPAKTGPQQQGPAKTGPQEQGPAKTGPQQQGPAKTGPQQQGPPLTGPQQQGPAKTGPQQQGPAKTGPQQQGPAKTGPQQQGPAKTGPQEQGPPKTGPQQQGPAKTGPQQQGPSETGPQQRGPAKTGPHQQGPAKTGPQEQGPAETGPQQQGPAKTGPQQKGPPKTGPPQQGPAKTGPPQQWPAKTGLPQQEPTKTGPPQQGPAKTGPPQQGPAKTGPPQQGPAKTGPQQKGPPKTGPQQQGPPLTGPVKLGPQQQGPAKPPFQQPDHRKDPSKQESLSSQSQGPPSSSTPAHKKTHCPLCTTTELLLHTPEKANYNTCTQCHIVVCSQCGFNPNPHMTEKEWLCLNCQTQRALTGQLGDMGKMTPPMPVSVKPAAKQPPGPKIQPGPTEQPPTQKSTEVITEPTPIQVQQKKEEEPYKGETPTVPVIEKKEEKIPPKQLTRTPSLDKTPPQKPKDISQPEVKIDKNEKASVTEPTKPLPDTPQKTDQVEQKKETDAPAVQKLDKTTPPLQVSKQAEGGPTTEPAETSLSRTQEKKHMTEIPVEAQSLKKPIQVETVKEKPEKEDDKSDTSGSSQQKSPQGLSDTGYSSDGISSSLGEIPSLAPSDEKDLLKEPSKKDLLSQESSPSSPSDLAKLESTVLSILEAQTSTVEKDPYSLYGEQERDRHRSRTLPITPESCSSDEEDLEDIQEVDEEALEEEDRSDVSPRKYGRKGHNSKNGSSASRQRYDSIEDSSESEHSPLPQRKKRMSIGSSSSDEYKEEDSQGSGDEDFIRKQIIGMSADEDASASDDDDYIRTQIKGISAEQKKEHEDRKSKGKSTAGKSKRLTKKSSTSHEDDPGRRHSWHDRDQEEEVYDVNPESKFRETKSQENEELSISSGGGLRRFKTIELNSTTATPYIEGTEKQGSQEGYEGELEMESLTDSPEDRSRGEGSSSLQASSFTPGTSPTSVSSLDEDSDSSPSHKKMSGESKQQRKARHRAHGQVLPTIEDSSEEEELREEEELLMEQEKQRELEQQQRKSSSRKSKKDKDELRAQRRRERPKTPPSNLSPIEDASPTEELRQAAEMEELHRSSCSEYSPSIESEPEGFEISPDKILAVQKVYKLPTSVSLYSPTDEKNIDISQKATTPKSLKCADEVYEEMMQKAKLLQSQKETDVTHEKEPLYGGMLIEDYIYESLVEDTYSGTTDSSYLTAQQESSKGEVQEPGKKLRSPDQVFDDMMQKKNYQTEEEYYYSQPSNETLPQHAMSLPPSVSKTRQVSDSKGGVEPSTKEEKPLLDADAAYEELMKRQRAILTPGTSPTQPTPVSSDLSITSSATGFREIQGESIMSAPITGHEPATCTSVVVVTVAPLSSTIYPIPDVTITQHFTAEEDIEEAFINEYARAGKPVTVAPTGITNGFNDVSTNPESVQNGAVDLSTTKPLRTMVAVNESTSEVVTTIIEEDDKPVDLTAGRRAVCCDVVYKFPFGGICTSQQPATTLPEDRFGYRDDHYQYDRPGPYGMRGVGSMKPSMSETNLAEAGLFLYKSKNSFDYHSAVTEGAVDLTSGRLSAGEVMNYSSKSTGPYPETRQVISGTGISIPQYSQARIIPPIGTQYGVNSVLRSSNGVVYSSVAAPVPSTFAITTQPGSVFSTTYKDWSGLHTSDTMPSLSSLQNQPLPRSYSFLTTTAGLETSLQSTPLETLMTGQSEFIPTVTTASESYTDASLDAIALSLEALASPISYDESKQQQYQMERELLELEKLKQLRLAEELEWERQEIQRFREQDKLIVQQELEELHTMKHQLLLQQEEERHAHLMMQQETFAQQQMQLEQIQQLQHQLQQQLEEQKIRQIYQYSYDPSGSASPQTSSEQVLQDTQYKAGENGQYWPIKDETATSSAVSGIELQQNATWYTVPSEGIAQFIPSLPNSVSEMLLKDIDVQEDRQPRLHEKYEEPDKALHDDVRSHKKIVDSGVQTDDEDGVDRSYTGRRRRTKKSVDTSVQTDDEDQEEWDIPTRSRRRSRVSKYSDGTETDKNKHNSKVSSIAIQTVTEISVQTEPVGTIRTPSIRAQMDTKVDIKKHISASEKTYKGSSLSCQTETDADKQTGQYSPQKDKKRPTPLEIGYSTHLKADSSLQVAPSPPKSPKVLYSPISPVSPSKSLEFVPYEKALGAEITPQKMATSEASTAPPPSPRTMKMMQRSMSDPKPLSPTADESTRPHFQYSDGYSTKGSQSGTPSGTQKKVKRTLPNPPPEEDTAENQSGYTTVGSVSRRRICRTNTMARAKILQDIDRELDLVERESSKLRKKQAELDEEEKEIDAKLRYLEMGINRRKDALLKEREKRERAYLQGVAEERDYMSDSEISNIRGTRVDSQHGLERPRTAPQSEFDQFMPPQTQPESEYAEHTSPYTQYQYAPPSLPTQAPSQYPQQTHYQQQSLYHQQISPYQTQPSYSSVPTISYPQAPLPQSQQPNYQHPSQMLLMQKPRQTTLADLEPKITTNYEVIRNQPLMIVPSSTETTYAVPHMGSKYNNLDLRIGLDERSSMVSSPISNISADSFYAEIEQHTPRNYVLIDDIGELTKGSTSLSSTFNIPDKDLTKTDRLLRTGELRRTPEVTDFLGPLQTSSRMHTYGKADEDPMEDPYELKVLKQQIKQEFRRGTEGLDHMSGLPHYYQSDSSYRHFPKTEKYSISRLTLEKQAAKQLPSSVLYQKQTKQKKPLMDPKVTKFSPIQESRDIEPDYSNYLASSTSSVSGLSSRAKLLQDDITFGLRKNISDQQKYLGSTLGANLAHSLGNALNLVPNMRSSLHDDLDKPYPSGTRSRPSSRPSSVYGLDLSIKRDSSSTSLRLKTQENEPLDVSYTHASPSVRTKPTSLPISQSRGRIPIVAQNSEEESPLSPVGQPMGMARAAAGPLPPISADTREQFGSSHSLPEVQQHMREESRTCGYDRDIAFIMDDFQHAMSDSEGIQFIVSEVDYVYMGFTQRCWLRVKVTMYTAKPIQYSFPYSKIKLQKDPKDHSVSGNGLGIRVVGGKDIPGNNGEIGAYIAKILPGGIAEQTGKVVEGMQVLEWNGISLIGKTYEEVQSIVGQQCGEAEICVRLDLNMLSDSKNPEHLELQDQTKAAERQRSPGVDPKQLAAELQKVSQQQSPSSVTSATEKGTHIHSGTPSAASSAVPSPGQPGSPSVSKKRHSSKPAEASKSHSHPITGEIQLQVNYDKHLGNLIVHVLQARNLAPRDNNGYSDPFVKVYLLPGRGWYSYGVPIELIMNLWELFCVTRKCTRKGVLCDEDTKVLIDLSNTSHLDSTHRWYPLKEQSESIDHGKSHSGQSSQQSPKPSVSKSRSHGIFPDPSKDMQVPTIEKSHSSPGSSKSSSEGHLRSHGPSRSQSKTSVTQTHLEDAGAAIAAAEAAVQQLRLQPTVHKSGLASHAKKQHRHSIAGVLPIQRTQSDNLPSPAKESKDTSQLAIRKVMSEGSPKPEGGKTQIMGEIKIALKKEMKTEGEQLVVEILQCRNITYKFKSPDHLPDLYVKLYVINVATQKRVIKKKTRVCRHDREPSFNETFRFSMNPAGHSIQMFLVSNGGKFMKKTLIGEAYIWLDKVDLRKKVVNWHKLLVSSTQSHA